MQAESRSDVTRGAIRRAAADVFATKGFNAASVREIAAIAKADPAMVIRHFGSKEALFLEVVADSPSWRAILDGPIETLGQRAVEAIMHAGSDTPGYGSYAALMRASDRLEVRRRLAASLRRDWVAPLVDRLPGPDPQSRAYAFAAQLNGLMTMLWVIEDEAITALPREQFVTGLGEALQLVLTGPMPGRTS